MEDYYINPTEDALSLSSIVNDKTKSPVKKQLDQQKHPSLIMPISPPIPERQNNNIMKKMLKYIIEGLVVGLVAYYFVGKNKLSTRDAVIIGVTAAFVLAILDMLYPTNQ